LEEKRNKIFFFLFSFYSFLGILQLSFLFHKKVYKTGRTYDREVIGNLSFFLGALK